MAHLATSTMERNSSANVKPSSKRTMVSVLIVLLGVAILLYPVISTVWNNWMEQRAAEEYSRLIQATDEDDLVTQLERAVEYNKSRPAVSIADPWNNPNIANDEGYALYSDQLSLYNAMARIRIPTINVDLPVFHGTSHKVLSSGVGHLYGTDLPVGGEGTHSVLTGHTGLQTSTMFDNLKDIQVGDSIYIEVYGETLRYQVYGTEVVLPEQTESLSIQKGRDLITLITCTPYGVNSHRLLVHAERAPYDPGTEAEIEGGWKLPGQLWMWGFGMGALLAILLLITFLRSSKYSAKHKMP